MLYSIFAALVIISLAMPSIGYQPVQAGRLAQEVTPTPEETPTEAPTAEPTLEPTLESTPELNQENSEGLSAGEVEAAASASDWPMYMHDASHSGRTAATAYTNGPLSLQWAYAFGERVEVEAQPVMANGVLYQGVMNGEMHAIDAITGKKIWISRPGGPIPHTAAVVDGRVFFGSLDGRVYALQAADGALAWSFTTNGPVVSAPAVVNGTVYIGSNDGSLYAFDAASGALRWSYATHGPVVSSPAVANGRVYFGSEDLKARAVSADSGALLWETQLYGAGMRNTHPTVADNGNVVIFVTVKPGGSSYVPVDPYPEASITANPVTTWNNYYQSRRKYRTLYYLNAQNGSDLWDPGSQRYSPLPIPYWGLLQPVLAPDGTAWFPAPSGAAGHSYELDHDDRLFKIDLTTGVTTMVAGGPNLPEFQTRSDEVGRHAFAGNDFLYTSSEDLSVYHPDSNIRVLYGDGGAPYFDIGSHMHPLSPLPSRHLWRYGGVVAMGGVPGAGVPIAGNGMIYYSSYGWLYAVGQENRNLKPATSFPKRDARRYELTYPRATALSTAQIREELARRVADIVARGPQNPPIAVRWEQPGDAMMYNESNYEIFGWDWELVRSLAEALPYLPEDQQAALKAYLKTFVSNTLLKPSTYDFVTACVIYGEEGVRVGNDVCAENGRLVAHWSQENPQTKGLRLYALWAYGNATGDWDGIKAAWKPLILPLFQEYLTSYSTKYQVLLFAEWRTRRLNMPAQILATQAMRDMSVKVGDTAMKTKSQSLLTKLLNGRVYQANFVSRLYASGKLKPFAIRLNADGTIRAEDIIGPRSPYNDQMIPYNAEMRNASTDPGQLNWISSDKFRTDTGTGFMHYQAMSQYYPLSSELTAKLRAKLLSKTNTYLKSYEVNNPWWWMADLAHHTTGSGEHLYHSPTLSYSMFQVKARVMRLPFDTLVLQLPEPVSFNSQYDLYRLQNLVALLDTCRTQNCKR